MSKSESVMSSNPALADCLNSLAEIMTLCQGNAKLTPIANARLGKIIDQLDETVQTRAAIAKPPKARAEVEIDQHLAKMRKVMGVSVKPSSVTYRDIAQILAKKHDLEFDAKVTKKKEDLMKWFTEHWDDIRNEFFVLLGGPRAP